MATIERNIKQNIPLHHPIVGWAAQYAADCVNRYVLREDGLSAFQKLCGGGNARQPVASFGECVLFPMLKREQETWGEEVEHAGRWAKAVWLGRSWHSNENLVVHAHGISRPRTVKRLPTQSKWRADLIGKVATAPWGEDLAQEEDDEQPEEEKTDMPEVALEPDPKSIDEQKVQEEKPAMKGIYFRRADFAKHGWTEGCAKCRFMLLHPGREGGPIHSNQCKERLIQALKATPAGAARVRNA